MRSVLCAIFGALFLASSATSQAAPAISGPEYNGVFEAITQGGRVPLERQVIVQKIRSKFLGVAGTDIELQVKGEHSPVRLNAVQTLAFVVRVASQDNDPLATVQLFRMTPTKGARVLTTASVGWTGVGDAAQKQAVSFDAAKYGNAFFKLTPRGSLQPGEYMLRMAPNPNALDASPGDGFLFGID